MNNLQNYYNKNLNYQIIKLLKFKLIEKKFIIFEFNKHLIKIYL